jgi:hypothetical protein
MSTNFSHKPAPRWFRKLKKALTLLADTACVILLTMGFQENSFLMLCLRVGLSGVLQSLEIILSGDEEYVKVDELDSVVTKYNRQ